MTSAADFASRSDYGICPECGGEFQIRVNGTLRAHRLPRKPGSHYATPTCKGTGRLPNSTTAVIHRQKGC